ncbi:MAG: cytochrome c oxidase subunit II [Crocinitomicaceae bacterium]|nr:cytochrome c oxidase subunit II [Crocinitomicaceae bacterium]
MGIKLIVLVVIVLAVIAVAQIMRVYELSSKLKGHREEDVDLKANNLNAGLFLVFLAVFFGSFFWMLAVYGNGLNPPAASEHGQDVDWLFNINWAIVFTVFLSTNFLLFFFAYKYSYNPDRKAFYFPHDNKLEMIWTIIPAAALAVIIILGLMTWNSITGKPSDDAVIVEIYAKQFDFTARYSGDDNKLGYADYKLVNGTNPLGVITEENIETRLAEIDETIENNQTKLDAFHSDTGEVTMSAVTELKLQREIEKMGRIRMRIEKMQRSFTEDSVNIFDYANDDFMTKITLFMVKDQEYQFVFRSQDVIHSAYFPHFRAQMNCVPGMRTTLKFKPIFTTQEMKEMTGNPDFEYILLCNKICGASHYNMNMPVYVGTQEEFDAWVDGENNVTPIIAPATEETTNNSVEEGNEEAGADESESNTDDSENGPEA